MDHASSDLSKVAARRLGRSRRDAHTRHGDALSIDRRDLDVHAAGSESRTVLPEVVGLALGRLPGGAAVGGDLELGDGDVGVHDLHAEPVGRGAFLVLEHDGRGDTAGDNRVADGDDALGLGAELGEGVFEEVELVDGALGALVDDLGKHIS